MRKSGRRRSRGLTISDHAIVRYFERALGFNIQKIKEELLTDELKERIEVVGDGAYKSGDYNLIVRNNIVVTIIPAHWSVTLGVKK